MKTLILFLFISAMTFGQATYFYADSIKSTDSSNVHIFHNEYGRTDYDFIQIKITLSNAADSVYIKTGLSDGTTYGLVGLKDQLTGDNVGLITGNTSTNRGYLVLYAPRSSYINIYSNDKTLGGTINYKIEAK